MAKALFGAMIGVLLGVVVSVSLLQLPTQAGLESARYDRWHEVAQAQLELTAPPVQGDLAMIAALAEELHALREQRARRPFFDVRRWLATPPPAGPASDEDEDRAIDFLIAKVTSALDVELRQWQENLGRLNQLGPVGRDAAMRLIAFAKWQQKGGGYEYAYDFVDELARSSAHPAAVVGDIPPVSAATGNATAHAQPTPPKHVKPSHPAGRRGPGASRRGSESAAAPEEGTGAEN